MGFGYGYPETKPVLIKRVADFRNNAVPDIKNIVLWNGKKEVILCISVSQRHAIRFL